LVVAPSVGRRWFFAVAVCGGPLLQPPPICSDIVAEYRASKPPTSHSELESGTVEDDSLLPWVFVLPERRKGWLMVEYDDWRAANVSISQCRRL
ncbi:hypothetical protein LINPERPRIM_LOCUS38009, partial [Linum perenne]